MDGCISGDVHLLDGTGGSNGRVEVCVDARWLTVCDNGWTDKDAEVVCHQLGLPVVGECNNAFSSLLHFEYEL